MIELSGMGFRYPRANADAISQFNLSIARGEHVALVGPSGSGKTTLLYLIAAMLPMQAGSYSFDGHRVHDMNESALDRFRSQNLGMVFQQASLLPHLSLLENVMLPISHRREERGSFEARAMALLDELGLDKLAARLPSAVSGGQAQRAAIARALISSPKLVVADEPTSALDDEAAEVVIRALKLACGGQTTLVLATHDARVLGDSVRVVQIRGDAE